MESFFAARPDNELGDKSTSIYTKAWSPDKNDKARFRTLTADIDNVILATDKNRNIPALHSFKVAGGTLLRQAT